MEHRLDHRNTTDITITLYCAAQLLGNFQIRNLSVGGAGLADPQQQLKVGDFIAATFPPEHIAIISSEASTDTQHDECLMHGLVVHTGKGVAGIMWASVSSECFQLLPGLLAA